jgi:hypothetical protein
MKNYTVFTKENEKYTDIMGFIAVEDFIEFKFKDGGGVLIPKYDVKTIFYREDE